MRRFLSAVSAGVPAGAALFFLHAPLAAAQEADPVIFESEDGSDGGSTDYGILVGTFTADLGGSDFGLYGLAGALVGDVEGGLASLGVTYDPDVKVLGGNAFVRVGYLGVYDESTPSRPDPQDDRARLELHWNRTFGDVTLQHRSRFEHRFRDIDDQTRYRPRLRAVLNNDRTVSPFVSAELFYAFQSEDVQLLLGEAGVRVALSDRWSLSGSYLTNVAFDDSKTNIGLLALSTRF